MFSMFSNFAAYAKYAQVGNKHLYTQFLARGSGPQTAQGVARIGAAAAAADRAKSCCWYLDLADYESIWQLAACLRSTWLGLVSIDEQLKQITMNDIISTKKSP